MDRILTIVLKLEHSEQKPPYLARQMSKSHDTSTSIATRVACCGLLLEGLSLL
jgi:hypothetical protein